MPKATEKTDMHPADIKAALAKKGYTFARIAREHGYAPNSPNAVLNRSWPAVEEIVGRILRKSPRSIWPSRYQGRKLVTARRNHMRTRL